MTTTSQVRDRVIAAWAAAAVLVVGVGACGHKTEPEVATAGSQPAASPNRQQAANSDVATYVEAVRSWVNCLRKEGIEVTDPDATGIVTFPNNQGAAKSDPKLVAAQKKCDSLAPAVPESVQELRRPKLTADQIATNRRYAECMQKNGAPDFPDPDQNGNYNRNSTWNQTSEGARKATATCASIIGDPAPDPTGRG